MDVVSVSRAQAKQYLDTLKSRQGDPSTIKTLADQLAQPNRTTFEVPRWLTMPVALEAVLSAARPSDGYQVAGAARAPAAAAPAVTGPTAHPAVAGVARPPNDALNLRALNEVRGKDRPAALGRAAEIFESGIQGTTVRGPGHQFMVDGGLTNRVMSTKALPAAVDGLAAMGQRAVYSQFVLSDTLAPAVMGVGHTLGLSSAGPGKPSLKSSWPVDWGDPAQQYGDEAGHLIAVNYQGGVSSPLPAAEQQAYRQNADQWAALTLLATGHITDDQLLQPIAVRDQATLKQFAHRVSAQLDPSNKLVPPLIQSDEAQFVVANLGPQESTLLKRSVFEMANGKESGIGRLINEFQRAPGLTAATPERGWQHLVDKKLLTREQFELLKAGGQTSVMLQWLPEETRGWQAFGPTEPAGLTASPLNLTNLLWSETQRVAPLAALEKLAAETAKIEDPLGLDRRPFRSAISKTISDMSELRRAFVRGSAQDPVYDEFVARLKTSNTPADVKAALRDAESMYRLRDKSGVDDKYLPTSAFVTFAQGAPGTNSSVYQYVATAVTPEMMKPADR